MWITISGATGSGKNFAARILDDIGYKRIDSLADTDLSLEKNFPAELRRYTARLNDQLTASKLASREDVYTIRSFWDSVEVSSNAALDLEIITKEEHRCIDLIYGAFNRGELLLAPQALIYMKATKIDSLNRMALNPNNLLNEPYYNREVFHLDKMVEKVAVPVVEVEISKNSIEMIKKNLEFGLNSLRAANLYRSSGVWDRGFFK